MKASMNVVNDPQKENVVQMKLVDSRQKVIGKFLFHDRDATFDFGTFPVKDSGKPASKFPNNGMKHTCRATIADTNRVSGFEIRAHVAMIGER